MKQGSPSRAGVGAEANPKALWEIARPDLHDYTEEDWDFTADGYLKVFVHRRIMKVCGRCGQASHHFFVSHGDWRKVPVKFRSMMLCVDCYAAVS